MKKILDLIQLLISNRIEIAFGASILLSLIYMQSFKTVKTVYTWIYKAFKKLLLKISWGNLFRLSALSMLIFLNRVWISDTIQYYEQVYINPVYVISDSSAHALSCYEKEMYSRIDANEADTVKKYTYKLASEIGCSPLAIYEVAYSECGLNPFVVRRDSIAAGWIQFTKPGLTYLKLNNRPATMRDVFSLCKNRNAGAIMDLTAQYMHTRRKGISLPTSTDIYTCIFAPGYVGADRDKVLYSGWDNPAYYLNIGLDGYYVKQTDKGDIILRQRSACDGKITGNDLALALEYKRAQLVKKWDAIADQ